MLQIMRVLCANSQQSDSKRSKARHILRKRSQDLALPERRPHSDKLSARQTCGLHRLRPNLRPGRCALTTDWRDLLGIASSWQYNAGDEKPAEMTRVKLLSRITMSPRVS
jgi:hypothetical protein